MPYPAPKLTLADRKALFHGIWAPKPTFTEKDYPPFDGKVVIITGGSSGAGYETAKSLAGSTNAKIYIFSRNEAKTLAAIKKLKEEVAKEYKKKSTDVSFVQIDFNDLSTIKPAVEKFLSLENRLDIIIHNAGYMLKELGQTTAQGHELHWGINALGPHLLQKLLDPILIKTSKTNKKGESRIVWVASSSQFWAPKGGINWDDVDNKDSTDPILLYAQSKSFNIIQSITWPKKHPEATNVISSSLCPGLLKSDLHRDSGLFVKILSKLLFYNQRYGAYTELYAAFSPDITNGTHSIAFGVPGTIREDIKSDTANHDKAWKFLEENVKEFT
ncbi:short-chain alcohol dehydrogenase [Suhomyces tanzawaensis NRRL Y-17324]|uniref:Short-chain alcohol dehydrogenase n=1 Tax=Suhomyces tanzawaensis NRRL Y-17324 TaxID=984487 RepID=A0A1E4SED9_9ASCO|nr:short-chain alcohol dehydrogenase [Suhomyces tanzawaensis NRRL Y-17324]ODV77875.1 short-chain alcohol dehydrogenase [Suhomyces tanzawaensis NRRL Y-17324]